MRRERKEEGEKGERTFLGEMRVIKDSLHMPLILSFCEFTSVVGCVSSFLCELISVVGLCEFIFV